ncbi:unnamed protein product [Echinostoma caproni]|uniref:Transposase n=1 Tax=Echinostoma caproni TaxID=27848 RepID=A0A183BC17_9TREM|nr:unnamed protein product [Echinostoma caproni]
MYQSRLCSADPASRLDLGNLIINMQNCNIALKHREYPSDLDALHTSESIVRCLPAETQTAWATEADRIEKRNREATFDELAQFIGCQSDIGNSRFGQLEKESIRTARPLTNLTPSGSRGSLNPTQLGEHQLILI